MNEIKMEYPVIEKHAMLNKAHVSLGEDGSLTLGVCVATFRRGGGLRQLLTSIGRQRFEKVIEPQIEIFVADNDAEGSARHVVDDMGASFPYPLHYEVEKQQGIPFVRNRLVSMTKDCDLIAFVDDDEEADTRWLDELLSCYFKGEFQVVTGPVVGRFASAVPSWVVQGKFYDSPRCDTGTSMDTFYTNNVLLERSLLNGLDKPFEENMAFCGGTDSLLAMRVLAGGGKCVWCDEAVVFEDVPASRLTIRWYLRRRYRIGNASVYCNRYADTQRTKWHELIRSVKLTFLSIAVCLSSIVRGSHKMLRGLGYFSQAVGIVAAVFRMQVNEYGRSDYRN